MPPLANRLFPKRPHARFNDANIEIEAGVIAEKIVSGGNDTHHSTSPIGRGAHGRGRA